MKYILDTNIFITISYYYPNRFPSFWEKLQNYINNEKIISTREVLNELKNHIDQEFLLDLINSNKEMFPIPNNEELRFVAEIFKVRHFQQIIQEKQRLKGTPVADPFVIAAAKIKNGCVVSQESYKENAAKIPNICAHFNIDCINLEEFMNRENWKF